MRVFGSPANPCARYARDTVVATYALASIDRIGALEQDAQAAKERVRHARTRIRTHARTHARAHIRTNVGLQCAPCEARPKSASHRAAASPRVDRRLVPVCHASPFIVPSHAKGNPNHHCAIDKKIKCTTQELKTHAACQLSISHSAVEVKLLQINFYPKEASICLLETK